MGARPKLPGRTGRAPNARGSSSRESTRHAVCLRAHYSALAAGNADPLDAPRMGNAISERCAYRNGAILARVSRSRKSTADRAIGVVQVRARRTIRHQV